MVPGFHGFSGLGIDKERYQRGVITLDIEVVLYICLFVTGDIFLHNMLFLTILTP